MKHTLLAGLLLLSLGSLGSHAEAGGDTEQCVADIATRLSPVRDTYHGRVVEDPYRWLEDWSDAAVRSWSEQQSACARRHLDALPDAPKIRARLTQILTVERGTTYSDPKYRGGRLFVLRKTPQAQQTALVWFAQADVSGPATLVLDPMQLDPSGDTSIDWFVPSHDGARVAVSLSSGGSEGGTLRVFDTTSGRPTDDLPLEGVSKATASGDVAWSADGRGFFYTRYPRAGEVPERELSFHQQIYYHQLGTAPATDRYELGKQLPSISAIRLSTQAASGRVIAKVQNGDSGQFRFFVRETDGRWRPFGDFGDGHVDVAFGAGDELFVVTKAGVPRGKVLRLSAKDLNINRARTVIPESDLALAHNAYAEDPPTTTVTDDAILLLYQLGGPTQLRIFSLDGKPRPAPTQVPMSHVTSVNALGDDRVLFGVESFVTPEYWVRYDARTGVSETLQSAVGGSRGWSDVSVEREFAVSRDGTRVPVSILRMRGVKTRGLLLNAYGGFNIARLPSFAPQLRVLLEQGIAYAAANVRGGSEFGEQWHRQGNLDLKQNVFDDFIAVAQHLQDEGIAPRGKLAITGTSNGGLLMGAVLTQRPQLAQAVISNVGIYDSLRTELDPNGAFNVPEYGTVLDQRLFSAIRAYSPYHNVHDGGRYPPTLLLTGANDNRVNPMHSRKMIARLQAANASHAPLLLRTSANTGHGMGMPMSAQIEELTDIYSFIMQSLGIAYRSESDSVAEYIAAVEGPQTPDRKGYDALTVEQLMRRLRVPGAAVAVIKDFKIHWSKAYGIADVKTGAKVAENTLFQAASISKPVTAMAMLKAAESGKFAVDADINTLLHAWKLAGGAFTSERRVTPRMLASHTSGLGDGFGFPGYAPGVRLPTVIQILNGQPPSNVGPVLMERAPLQAFKYSGGGYTILQLALTETLGRPFPELLQESVLGPIGMTHSAFEQPLSPARDRNAARAHDDDGKAMGVKWHVYPELAAAGLWTTPVDLAKFVIEVQQSVHGQANHVLSRTAVQEMLSPVGVGDFAVGLSIRKRGQGWYFEHGGSNWGFMCLVIGHKLNGYGLAVMTNAAGGQRLIDEIQQRVERVYGWDSLDEPVPR